MTEETGVCKPLQVRPSTIHNPPPVLQRQKQGTNGLCWCQECPKRHLVKAFVKIAETFWNDPLTFLWWNVGVTGPNSLLSPPYCGTGHNTCGRDTTYGNMLPLPRDMKLCWLKYENTHTLSGFGLKWGNCTFQSFCMENICNSGREKHVWKFTASCWAPFSQEVRYIGSAIPNPGEYWWGEERRKVAVSGSLI